MEFYYKCRWSMSFGETNNFEYIWSFANQFFALFSSFSQKIHTNFPAEVEKLKLVFIHFDTSVSGSFLFSLTTIYDCVNSEQRMDDRWTFTWLERVWLCSSTSTCSRCPERTKRGESWDRFVTILTKIGVNFHLLSMRSGRSANIPCLTVLCVLKFKYEVASRLEIKTTSSSIPSSSYISGSHCSGSWQAVSLKDGTPT